MRGRDWTQNDSCRQSRIIYSPMATSLGALAQCHDHQGEGGRRLAAAGIIEVIPRKGRTPVGQNTHQVPGGDIRLHLILRQVGQSKPCERGVQAQSNVIEDKLSLDMHLDLAAVLREFPGIEAAVRRQAKINAFVGG